VYRRSVKERGEEKEDAAAAESGNLVRFTGESLWGKQKSLLVPAGSGPTLTADLKLAGGWVTVKTIQVNQLGNSRSFKESFSHFD